MKKIFVFLTAYVLSCALFFTGCSRFFGGGTETTEDFGVNVEIDRLITAELSIITSSSEYEVKLVEKAIESFNLKYPNVTFTINYLGTGMGTYQNTIRNLWLTDMLDDIMWTCSPLHMYLIGNEVSLNLAPFFKASEKAGIFDFEDDFYTEFFDMCSSDGKQYIIPRSCDSVVTMYNKEVLNSAGVDMSTIKDGWTWDDLMAACKKVRDFYDNAGKNSTSVLDMDLSNWLSVSYPVLRSFGADVADADGKITIDSQATRDCLEFIRDLVNKRYIDDSSAGKTSSFEGGTAAFLFQSLPVTDYNERRELTGKIDAVSFPLIMAKNTPKIGAGIAGYAINRKTLNEEINADTKKSDLAWAFLNHMISYDGQQALGGAGLKLPSVRKDLSSDNPAANWNKSSGNLNMNAYTYGSAYKIDIEFMRSFPAGYMTDLDFALKDLFINASDKTKSIESCIATAVRDFNNAVSA